MYEKRSVWARTAILALAALAVGAPGAQSAARTRLAAESVEGSPVAVALEQLAMNLDRPVFLTNAGDGSGRLFIVEKDGKVRVYKNGQLLSTPFLDIETLVEDDGNEQGLLSVAFHPNYETNGKFFVYYTGRGDNQPVTIAEYTATPSSDVANTNGRILLTIPHPTFENHNGGQLQFGPDGFLYIGTGDGGSANDPGNNGQMTNSLLGKILRIDVDSGSPYGIPPDNPFAGSTSAREEIYAYGMRNPWRFSFDRARPTTTLYAGDVGQNRWEEIDIIEKGGNYGWKVMEGFHCRFGTSGCDTSPYDLPIFEYDHEGSNGLPSGSCSITGGYVYRGTRSPSLYGAYIFADYCIGVGTLYMIRPGDTSATPLPTGVASEPVTSFGEGEDGELYVLTDRVFGGLGRVYRILGPTGGCALSCGENIAVDDADANGSEVVAFDAPQTVGECGQVTCQPASGAAFAVGTTTVTCTSASSGTACSFSVTVAGSGFSVTGVDPASANRKANLTISIQGSGFAQGATVSLGTKIKINSTTVVSASRIDVQVKVKKKAVRGGRDVVVTNPGGATATCTGCFTVN